MQDCVTVTRKGILMKLFIVIVMVLFVALGVVYNVSKASPRPNKSAVAFALERNVNYTPVLWNYEFGDETARADGTPAWPVIYNITTSSPGKGKEIVEMKLLFYLDGLDWKTDKI